MKFWVLKMCFWAPKISNETDPKYQVKVMLKGFMLNHNQILLKKNLQSNI